MSLLSTFFDMDMIGELPLTELPSLLSYAEEQEREQIIRSIYLEYFNACIGSGTTPMSYIEYCEKIKTSTPTENVRDSEDILTDMQRIEELYRTSKES